MLCATPDPLPVGIREADDVRNRAEVEAMVTTGVSLVIVASRAELSDATSELKDKRSEYAEPVVTGIFVEVVVACGVDVLALSEDMEERYEEKAFWVGALMKN